MAPILFSDLSARAQARFTRPRSWVQQPMKSTTTSGNKSQTIFLYSGKDSTSFEIWKRAVVGTYIWLFLGLFCRLFYSVYFYRCHLLIHRSFMPNAMECPAEIQKEMMILHVVKNGTRMIMSAVTPNFWHICWSLYLYRYMGSRVWLCGRERWEQYHWLYSSSGVLERSRLRKFKLSAGCITALGIICRTFNSSTFTKY